MWSPPPAWLPANVRRCPRSRRSGKAWATALALASGVTPDNLCEYADLVDAVLVATGINYDGDFYNIDPVKLRRLVRSARTVGAETDVAVDGGERDRRWYLSLMAPRSRGEKYAWLDPSSAYINARSFNHILDDLLEPFSPEGWM